MIATTANPAPRIGKTKGGTMPPVSQNQRGAMAAAASGKSSIGIPRKIGKEFMAADKGGKLPRRTKKQRGKGLINGG